MAGFLGIGLGGFMSGFKQGQDIRLDKERSTLARERYDRQKVLDQREDAAYQRTEDQRQALEGAVTKSNSDFQAAVNAGTAKPEDSDEWFATHTVPLLKNTYLAKGDIDNADRVQQWADTADAKAGARLFKSAMLKAQSGDGIGALDDAIKVGQKQGYIAHGYEVQKHDKIVQPDGTLVGYRIWLTDPEGKEVQQDILAADLPKTIATFLNPEAAWESQLAAGQAEKKRQDALDDYRTKKEIDKEVGLGDSKLRGSAITALRKRMDGGLGGEEAKFDDLPADQKEKLISEEIQLQRGGTVTPTPSAGPAPGLPAAGSTSASSPATQPASTGRKVLVDTVTGRTVPTKPQQGPPKPAVQTSADDALGIIDRVAGNVRREIGILTGKEAPKQTSDARQPNASGKDRTRRSDGLRRQDNIAYQVSAADVALREGVPLDRVVQGLLANGVPEEEWPASVKRALVAKKNDAVVGLGR